MPFEVPQKLPLIVAMLPNGRSYDLGKLPELRDIEASGIFVELSEGWPPANPKRTEKPTYPAASSLAGNRVQGQETLKGSQEVFRDILS